jgi:hypothetical protein
MKKILNFIVEKIDAGRNKFNSFVQKQDAIYFQNPKAYKTKMDWFFFRSVLFFGSIAILSVWGASLWMS